MTRKNHECFKPFCANCNKNMEINHFCYMQPLKNELPSADDVLFVFCDFETTQDAKISETAKLHVPILICVQQFCTACEMQDEDDERDCARCGKRRHSFFEDPVGDLLSYLCEPRPWCKKVVAIPHNAKAFDSQFILNRATLLKWIPELILNGLKIVRRSTIFNFWIRYPTCPCLCASCPRHLGWCRLSRGIPITLTRTQI